ncbi:MAG: hypothetical protein ISS15_09365 [Alphaproteobacteria bacterium]|nr:hypothetical protein [Alphaproteobacteria bacterium]MBL6938789.1 hypothetical protein [Alphaproteobacteria bacterium]MBL7097854.1 hypothetical protein [Alphaproteobacteria bacterium]
MLTKQIVAFIDLLGFSSIIRQNDEVRLQQVLGLLKQLADAVGEFNIAEIAKSEQRREVSLRPAISAFSDNIVFSFRLDRMRKLDIREHAAVHYLAHDVARIFMRAIDFGCAVRGGIAVGDLFHEGRVVFGPALVEAYELESNFAHEPRVLLSPEAAKLLKHDSYLVREDDGFDSLHFLRAAFDASANSLDWHAKTRARVEKECATLKDKGNLKGYQYWSALLTRFDRLLPRREN